MRKAWDMKQYKDEMKIGSRIDHVKDNRSTELIVQENKHS